MKRKVFAVMTMAAAVAACDGGKGSSEAKLDSEMQKVSYSFGVDLGKRIGENMELDVAAFSAGVSDGIEGGDLRMSEEDMMATLQGYQQKKMAEMQAEAEQEATKNQKESEAFLAKNAEQEGVVVLDSGLQYKVVEAGDGATPTADDVVEVHYRGTLIDGTEFDSSYARGESITFPVGGVIAGWTEALQLMPVGSKWELYIPSDLAYGPGGTQGAIGPNQALIFEVELLGIEEEQGGEG
ncbi:FKBP-type peptidyl-prolyl cis-trans isomerase [Litorivivens lipolytica]|uniref:Peptidyl-prolyl cis-trans isomerase n=1 Tax=Litorivivens lipolytica TaxID=1524264 RepID=A0A7W4Z6I8_9GAMM|nr:FKBP-type peptidyl-prolyl cis-trans isomerase [Litorivivens lipolytica]MBB3048559.1 FKBP-type peptidyl-prolyl cis-trans isomerase [Litorivivens lipolytica]